MTQLANEPTRRNLAELSAAERDVILTKLDELHVLCMAGQAYYDVAAKELPKEPALQELFGKMGAERRAFADRIGTLMVQYGKEPSHTLGALADLHRFWIDVRATLEHHNPASMIAECESGERTALTKYEAVLRMRLTLDVEDMLIDQAATIREARASLDRMRRPW